MFKYISSQVKSFLPVVLAMAVLPGSVNAASVLATDLQALVTQSSSLNTQISSMSLNSGNSCTELGSAIASVELLTASIEDVSVNLSAPLSMDVDSLNALDSLTITSAGIAGILPFLSTDITSISLTSSQADIQASLDAMLKLSDEIGVMADRILEMSDKILVMADNIGLMADRILLTQQIQSANLALTQSAMLTTQQNIVLLSQTISTALYNTPLSALIDTGSMLSLDLNNSVLTKTNMSAELADFETRVSTYLNSVMLMVAVVNNDTAIASQFLNADTLTMFGDLSVINAALAASLNAYAQAVNTLAPTTDIAVLNDAVYSMLRLASDIGVMGGRIVEMGDDISIMADNIGLMSLNIIATQTLQQSNLNLTQSNLTAAQITTVSVIAAYGL